MPRLFYLPLVQPGVLLSLKAAKSGQTLDNQGFVHKNIMSVGYEKDVFPFLQERVELSSDLHLQMIFSVMI